jgi:hypothetical protein
MCSALIEELAQVDTVRRVGVVPEGGYLVRAENLVHVMRPGDIR